MTFGELLRNWRKDRPVSQTTLSKILKDEFNKTVKQSTISAWENGQYLPDDDSVLIALAQILDKSESIDQLRQAIEREKAKMRPSNVGLTPSELLKDAQAVVRDIGHAQVHIMFLGPEHLPIAVGDPDVEEAWVENVSNGATLIVIWWLDETKAFELRRLGKALYRVDQKIQDNASASNASTGSIVHYATYLFAEHSADVRDLDSDTDLYDAVVEYNHLRKEFEKSNVVQIHHNISLTNGTTTSNQKDEFRNLRSRISKYWQRFGSIIVYSPQLYDRLPFATLSLNSVCNSLHGRKANAMFWFEEEIAQQMNRDLKSLVELFDSVEKSMSISAPSIESSAYSL